MELVHESQAVFLQWTDQAGFEQQRALGPEPLTVGRAPENHLVLNDRQVSRAHAQFIYRDGIARVEDLGSSNGTYVNELRVPESELHPGDRVRIGGMTFTVGEPLADQTLVGGVLRILTTVLFTDIVDSTGHAARLGDREWRQLLDRHNQVVRRLLREHRGREVATAGDGFLALFDSASLAIRCALAITDQVRPLGIEVRAGVHSGECDMVGTDVSGLAVHVGARVSAAAGSSEVLVSDAVVKLVPKGEFAFASRGSHQLKGVPDAVELLHAEPTSAAPLPPPDETARR